MENLIADKDMELSEKDEEIQQLRKQLEDTKKPQPDGVVLATSVVRGIVPPLQFQLQFWLQLQSP